MNTKRTVRLLQECFRYLRLHCRRTSLLVCRKQPHDKHSASGPIVTLTTLPSRIDKIAPALNSLLDQTVKPEVILLALPDASVREKKGYAVPPWLDHPLVKILPSGRDWGPATKIIPALQRFAGMPDTAILAVDDDNVYPRQFVETFVRFARVLPDASLSLRGWPIPPSRKWRDSHAIKGTEISAPMETDIITGCGGIMVRPRFFDDRFFDYAAAPREAFFVDDIWTSGHLARRKIAKFILPYSGAFVYIPTLTTFKGPALDRDENRSGRNNDVMIGYFAADWIK
jgi:hypothetical protein